MRFIREGRLQLSQKLIPNEFMTACQRCGQPTLKGRFCDVCRSEIAGALNKGTAPRGKSDRPESSGSDFHFKNMHKKFGKD